MTPTPPTLPQTICLLALSRNEQPYLPPATRLALLGKRWIVKTGDYRSFEITEAGRRALATSPHLGEAQRKLDAGKASKPWQGKS